jgi:hypothetical protein
LILSDNTSQIFLLVYNSMAARHSGHRVNLQIRRSPVRIQLAGS